jgi:nucleoside-diphosphate-sugar epimerase
MCYIDNVILANILASKSDKTFLGECYNVSCGDRTTNREILDYLLEKYPHALVRDAPWRQGDVMHTQADISKIKEDLGYEPLVKFWDGLERTITWWGLEDVSI